MSYLGHGRVQKRRRLIFRYDRVETPVVLDLGGGGGALTFVTVCDNVCESRDIVEVASIRISDTVGVPDTALRRPGLSGVRAGATTSLNATLVPPLIST